MIAEEFLSLGIGVVAITYDSNRDSRKFSKQHKITFPILQDVDARLVKELGILNEQYQPGHRAYGIPYPGVFLIDASGKISAKFAEFDFKKRPLMNNILESARNISKKSYNNTRIK